MSARYRRADGSSGSLGVICDDGRHQPLKSSHHAEDFPKHPFPLELE